MAEDRMLSDEILLGIINSKSGGGGGGTSDYSQLSNKPQINSVELSGNKSLSDLGIASATALGNVSDAVTAIKDGQTIDSFADVETALAGKQGTLTFDDTPTDGSNNPVKSNGIYDALSDKADKSAVKTEFIGTTAEWNALTAEQKKAYDTYQITDDFISGSGSEFVQQELYTGTSAVSTYALSDNISNYDLIYVYSSNSGKYDCTSIFRSDDVLATIEDSTIKLGVFNDSEYEYFRATADNALASVQRTNRFITKIIGFKFVDSGSASGGGGLQLYHETYTGTGTAIHVLSLQHTPVLINSVGRTDGKVVISPFSPKGLSARVDWIIPNTGNGVVGISEDNGIKITGVDAGQACNTENIEYDVYYLA